MLLLLLLQVANLHEQKALVLDALHATLPPDSVRGGSGAMCAPRQSREASCTLAHPHSTHDVCIHTHLMQHGMSHADVVRGPLCPSEHGLARDG